MDTYHCKCCREATLIVPDGSGPLGEICKICKWEDDPLEEDGWSSANKNTLTMYRIKWQAWQARELLLLQLLDSNPVRTEIDDYLGTCDDPDCGCH